MAQISESARCRCRPTQLFRFSVMGNQGTEFDIIRWELSGSVVMGR
jgi:hypothetical protein